MYNIPPLHRYIRARILVGPLQFEDGRWDQLIYDAWRIEISRVARELHEEKAEKDIILPK